MGRVCEKHQEFFETECRWCEQITTATLEWNYSSEYCVFHVMRRDGRRGPRLEPQEDGRMAVVIKYPYSQGPGCCLKEVSPDLTEVTRPIGDY